MVVVKDEQIVGYLIDQECVCRGCVKPSEETRLTLHNLIVQNEVNSGAWCFCDRCGKKIS